MSPQKLTDKVLQTTLAILFPCLSQLPHMCRSSTLMLVLAPPSCPLAPPTSSHTHPATPPRDLTTLPAAHRRECSPRLCTTARHGGSRMAPSAQTLHKASTTKTKLWPPSLASPAQRHLSEQQDWHLCTIMQPPSHSNTLCHYLILISYCEAINLIAVKVHS